MSKRSRSRWWKRRRRRRRSRIWRGGGGGIEGSRGQGEGGRDRGAEQEDVKSVCC